MKVIDKKKFRELGEIRIIIYLNKNKIIWDGFLLSEKVPIRFRGNYIYSGSETGHRFQIYRFLF